MKNQKRTCWAKAFLRAATLPPGKSSKKTGYAPKPTRF